jgi:hypothetical protein
MADGRRRRPEGFVVVDVVIAGATVPIELYVLEHCPFSGLIGFMTRPL